VRQFFSVRFWLTLTALVALVGLAVVVRALGPATSSVSAQSEGRRIDLVQWIFQATAAPGFAVEKGVTTADLSLQLDGARTMVVKAGTPGEVKCDDLLLPGRCTVAADLLGDAVLWFSIVPGSPDATIELPAVTELVGGGWARLSNDWVVRHAPRVERSCGADTSSLTDFINTFGDRARSTFNFETQRIEKVTCPKDANG
jgi:hypothetical protein